MANLPGNKSSEFDFIDMEPYIAEGKGGRPWFRGLRYGQCKAGQGNLHIY